MKKIIVFFLILLSTPAFATTLTDTAAMINTTEQLMQHVNSLNDLLVRAYELLEYEEDGAITLTQEQILLLLSEYETLKALILSTHGDLP